MVTAIFTGNNSASARDVWQYDYGQMLRIQGLKLPNTVEIHFSLQETGGTAAMRVGITKDGVTDVLIPDSMLENGDTTMDYPIFAFIYLTDAASGQTEYKIKIYVKSRPKPEAPGITPEPEPFHAAVQAVNDAANRAAESERQAEGYTRGRTDLPERELDNAKYYKDEAGKSAAEADRLAKSIAGVDLEVKKDLAAVQELTKQAQTSATNAGFSEQAAQQSETAAGVHRAAAETAENNAEFAEQEAKKAEQATLAAKQLVMQMGQQVLDNKNHVDQVVHGFELTAQQNLAGVNNAGQTQTKRVTDAGANAVDDINTTKLAAKKEVTDEGTKQVQLVGAEGKKQLDAVNLAVQGIVEDRQQIGQNATDITTVKNDLNGKADAIIETASGEQITLNDSDDFPLKGLRIFGKSTQNGVPSITTEIPVVSVGQLGKINMTIGKGAFLLSTGELRSCEVSVNEDYIDKNGKKWIADIIDFSSNSYIQKIGKYVFDGTENIQDAYFPTLVVEMRRGGLDGQRESQKEKLRTNYGEVNFSNNDCRMFGFESSEWGNADKTALQNFLKERYMSGHPVYVLYRLKTPITRAITPSEADVYKKMYTNYPTTTISNNESAHMEVSYVADTKIFILNEIAKYHAQAQAQQVAMMSLLPDSTQAAMIENDTNNILNGQGV